MTPFLQLLIAVVITAAIIVGVSCFVACVPDAERVRE